MGLLDSIIGAESGGDPNARNPNSSASGLGQFIDSTWIDTIRKARPDLAGKTDAELIALKSDPQLSRDMTAAYAADNGRILSQAGHEATPGNTYLAHFAGPQGAVSVLNADPSTPVSAILGPAVAKANPFLSSMTAGDLRAWADRKMGTTSPAPQRLPAAPAAPLNITPSAPPIFAQPAPQQQAQAEPQQAPAFEQSAPFMSIPQGNSMMSQAPIFYAQRRSPDLSRLKAAMSAPIYARG